MFVTIAKPLILLFSFSALLSLTHAHMGMYVIAFVVAGFPILTQKIAPLREEGGCYLHLFKLILSAPAHLFRSTALHLNLIRCCRLSASCSAVRSKLSGLELSNKEEHDRDENKQT